MLDPNDDHRAPESRKPRSLLQRAGRVYVYLALTLLAAYSLFWIIQILVSWSSTSLVEFRLPRVQEAIAAASSGLIAATLIGTSLYVASWLAALFSHQLTLTFLLIATMIHLAVWPFVAMLPTWNGGVGLLALLLLDLPVLTLMIASPAARPFRKLPPYLQALYKFIATPP